MSDEEVGADEWQRLSRSDSLFMVLIGQTSPMHAALPVEAGANGVVLDCEHGFPLDTASIWNHAQAVRAAGGCTHVRLGYDQRNAVGAILDVGIDGIVFSQVRDLADLRLCVQAMRFPPDGQRSLNPFVPGARSRDTAELRRQEDEIEIWAMLEQRTLIDDLLQAERDTAGVEWLREREGRSGFIYGPYDLQLDVDNDTRNSDLHTSSLQLDELVARAAQRAVLLGFQVGMFLRDSEVVERATRARIPLDMVLAGHDRDVGFRAWQDHLSAFRSALRGHELSTGRNN